MAKNSVPKLYWDSCVFLSLIEGDPARLDAIIEQAEAAERGGAEVYTSTLSIAEVAFGKCEKDGRVLNPAIQEKIAALWQPAQPFKLVEPHRGVMEEAQTLVRAAMTAGLRLSPADAVHIATAKSVGATFHSYDEFKGKRTELESVCGIKISPPPRPNLLFSHAESSSNPEGNTEPVADEAGASLVQGGLAKDTEGPEVSPPETVVAAVLPSPTTDTPKATLPFGGTVAASAPTSDQPQKTAEE